jgi:hypothetical protein
MKEKKRLARNKNRLNECYSVFAKAVTDVIADLESAGFRPRIQAAWRSPKVQLEKFNSGKSGVRVGFHNMTGPDGRKESLAVDLLDDDAPLKPSKAYVISLAIAARDHGLNTGIAWKLKKKAKARTLEAVERRDIGANVKIGFDPCHLEVTGLSIAEAAQGKRPDRQQGPLAGVAAALPTALGDVHVRRLLVHQVTGPLRAVPGEIATYRATAFNQPDPTASEKATINWEVRRDGVRFNRIHGAGATLEFPIPETLAGSSIRVMPFLNSPTPRVSVITRIGIDQATPVPTEPVHGGAAPRVVEIEFELGRVFASIDGGDRFFVGSDVRFRGSRGLMNSSDNAGARYKPDNFHLKHGFWADFIHPIALGESSGFFHRINTYDRARFTFGFFQLAAHTPDDNLVLFLRELLGLPLGPAYFPDLEVISDRIHHRTDSGMVALESRGSTQLLME